MKLISNCILAISVALLVSCCTDDPKIEIENPATYSFERNGESTVSFRGQTTRIAMAAELSSTLVDFDASEATLLEMYNNAAADGGDANPFITAELNESTKSVSSKVAASKDFFETNSVESSQIKAQFSDWIKAQVSEVYPNQNEVAQAGTAGQLNDAGTVRYVNGKGLEYNQAVSKGLIGALMVDQMLNNYLSTAVLDAADNIETNTAGTPAENQPYTNMEHKWDEAYGYLFGAAADAADPIADLGNDDFLNKYLSRVEGDSDFAGIADKIYQALKLGRAAIVAADYATRDKQIDIIKEEVSAIIAIRAVYYLQQGKNALANNQIGTAFHDLSEGYGFIYSLRFTRMPGSDEPYFNKSEVDSFIAQLDAGNGFWDLSAQTLDQVSADIAAKFDFTVAEAGE